MNDMTSTGAMAPDVKRKYTPNDNDGEGEEMYDSAAATADDVEDTSLYDAEMPLSVREQRWGFTLPELQTTSKVVCTLFHNPSLFIRDPYLSDSRLYTMITRDRKTKRDNRAVYKTIMNEEKSRRKRYQRLVYIETVRKTAMRREREAALNALVIADASPAVEGAVGAPLPLRLLDSASAQATPATVSGLATMAEADLVPVPSPSETAVADTEAASHTHADHLTFCSVTPNQLYDNTVHELDARLHNGLNYGDDHGQEPAQQPHLGAVEKELLCLVGAFENILRLEELHAARKKTQLQRQERSDASYQAPVKPSSAAAAAHTKTNNKTASLTLNTVTRNSNDVPHTRKPDRVDLCDTSRDATASPTTADLLLSAAVDEQTFWLTVSQLTAQIYRYLPHPFGSHMPPPLVVFDDLGSAAAAASAELTRLPADSPYAQAGFTTIGLKLWIAERAEKLAPLSPLPLPDSSCTALHADDHCHRPCHPCSKQQRAQQQQSDAHRDDETNGNNTLPCCAGMRVCHTTLRHVLQFHAEDVLLLLRRGCGVCDGPFLRVAVLRHCAAMTASAGANNFPIIKEDYAAAERLLDSTLCLRAVSNNMCSRADGNEMHDKHNVDSDGDNDDSSDDHAQKNKNNSDAYKNMERADANDQVQKTHSGGNKSEACNPECVDAFLSSAKDVLSRVRDSLFSVGRPWDKTSRAESMLDDPATAQLTLHLFIARRLYQSSRVRDWGESPFVLERHPPTIESEEPDSYCVFDEVQQYASAVSSEVHPLVAPAPGAKAQADGEKALKLGQWVSCHTCKVRYNRLHPYYYSMCHLCGEFNYNKRLLSRDLRGKVVMLTGCRIKIGYAMAISLLRCGAELIGLTRFIHEAVARFQLEPDYLVWRHRLHLFSVDLRDLWMVTQFCAFVRQRFPKIFALINNATQTIARTAEYTAHLRGIEVQPGPELRDSIAADPLSWEWHNFFLQHTCVTVGEPLRIEHRVHTAPFLLRKTTQEGCTEAVVACEDRSDTATAGRDRQEDDMLCGATATEAGKEETIHEVPTRVATATSNDATGVMVSSPRTLVFDRYDAQAEESDTRETNSWVLKLADVQGGEVAEVMAINTIAPFIFNSKLKPCLMNRAGDATPHEARFIVNVSAMEGQFYRFKQVTHPHTNMAKAALNMMTRTSGDDYAADGIYMNSVDTGWITDESPMLKKHRRGEQFLLCPLDEIDAAARCLDLVYTNSAEHSKFFKDYKEIAW